MCGGMPLPPPPRRRVPSSLVASFLDRARVDALLLPLVPDVEERAFVLRCLLDEGPAHHRGANYVLVALLGEVVRLLGAPACAPARPSAVPMRLPPHLAAAGEEAYYPLSLDLATLALLAPGDSAALEAALDCLTDGPPQHVVANVVMVELIGRLLAAAGERAE